MHTCAHAARLAPTVSVPPSAVSHCSSHRILSLAIIFRCFARFTFGGHGVDQAIAHVDLSGPQRWDKGPVYREGAADHTDKNRPANTALIRRYRDRHSFGPSSLERDVYNLIGYVDVTYQIVNGSVHLTQF